MIEKQENNYNEEKLRAILLYEADFNSNNGKLGRDMMYSAADLKTLACDQYVSLREHNASMHTVNMNLTFDLLRQQRKPAAICSNDAKSCYDRIVHSVAILSMRRLGAKLEPLICMFGTIQSLTHYVRTSMAIRK